MKKINYLIVFFLSLQFNLSAQVTPYQLDDVIPECVVKNKETENLKPVYFNYSRRRLFYENKVPLKGINFLETCRGINDLRIQYQIRKYDQLTNNKKKLLGAMIACAAGGFVGMMLSSAMLSSSGGYNQNGYAVLGVSAASLFIATPILGASTTIPHQKRKKILFRDLPEAYNFHVLSQTYK